MKLSFHFLIAALSFSNVAMCQDTSQYLPRTLRAVLVETTDGTSLSGTVLSENAKTIVLETKSLGTVTIQKSHIKFIKELDDTSFVNGSFRFENPSASYYVLGPSSFSLKKGEVNYQNYYIVGQSVTVGITNQFSISAGTELLTPITDRKPPRTYFVAARTNYRIAENFGIGLGILYVQNNKTGIVQSKSQYGIAYGQATFGKKNHNATLGIGWSYRNTYSIYRYTGESYTDKGVMDKPIVSFSAMTRVSKRLLLTSETWLFPEVDSYRDRNGLPTRSVYSYNGVTAYGVRFIGEKMSIDLGFLNNKSIAESIWIGAPYVCFAVKFGGEKQTVKK